MEQDFYGLLASMAPAAPLPDAYWVGCNPDHTGNRAAAKLAISKHYVSGVRYASLDYLRDGVSAMLATRRYRSGNRRS
jgi:hypothetical protein